MYVYKYITIVDIKWLTPVFRVRMALGSDLGSETCYIHLSFVFFFSAP